MAAPTFYLRNPAVVMVARERTYLSLREGKPPIVLRDIDVERLAQVLRLTVKPTSGAQLGTVCTEETVAVLVSESILVAGEEADLWEQLPRWPRRESHRRCRRVVLGVSGAVSAAVTLDYALALESLASDVEIVLTEGATRFVRPDLFVHYGFRVWTDDTVSHAQVPVPHIYLATNSDVVVIAPATANTIHKLATGACNDLLALVAAAAECPLVVAPAMNARMWSHPPVVQNVSRLRADGTWVVEPRSGLEVSERAERGGSGAGMGVTASELPRLLANVLDQT